MARKPTIYPEVIKPGDWQVEEWRPDGTGTPCPCTNNEERRMYVPAGTGKFAKEVRFHELLHVRYSPGSCPEIPGVTMPSLLSAEDCRVNLLGERIRAHDALGATPMPDPFALLMSQTERGMARLAAASLGYSSAAAWFAHLEEGFEALEDTDGIPDWAQLHAKRLRRAIRIVRRDAMAVLTYGGDLEDTTFDDTINLARWLDNNFNDGSPIPKQGPLEDPDGEDGDYDEEADDEGGNAAAAVWGDMRIETPQLSVRHKNAASRRTTASTKGSRIRHLNRMVTGAIFGRTRQSAPPDAVLIDDSGSMHWDADKFYKLVEQLPVGTIAAYSGEGGTGVLRILAKDGRMVPPDLIQTPYGGNEVDGPALRWLAQQRGRKVWVSDEGVCSEHGHAADLKADCDAIVRASGIKVCLTTDPDEIMQVLRK